MYDTRNIGYLKADFKAGDDITEYIFNEIRKRHVGWNANALYHIDLVADTPLMFTINGWTWRTNGTWTCSNAIIREIIINQDVTGLQMAFRYDD